MQLGSASELGRCGIGDSGAWGLGIGRSQWAGSRDLTKRVVTLRKITYDTEDEEESEEEKGVNARYAKGLPLPDP